MVQNVEHLVVMSKLVLDFCRLASIEKPWRWNELVTLSAKYRDLTANAQLALTVGFPLLYYLDKKWKKAFYLGFPTQGGTRSLHFTVKNHDVKVCCLAQLYFLVTQRHTTEIQEF